MSYVTTVQEIFEARSLLRRYMSPTPLYRYHSLSKLLGAEVYVKHENHTALEAQGKWRLLEKTGPLVPMPKRESDFCYDIWVYKVIE